MHSEFWLYSNKRNKLDACLTIIPLKSISNNYTIPPYKMCDHCQLIHDTAPSLKLTGNSLVLISFFFLSNDSSEYLCLCGRIPHHPVATSCSRGALCVTLFHQLAIVSYVEPRYRSTQFSGRCDQCTLSVAHYQKVLVVLECTLSLRAGMHSIC